jgi:hypothetical protein
MGPQQVLRALALGGLIAASVTRGAHAAPARERIAVIDLGPADDGAARRKLGTALVAAGLDPVMGDGVDDALAGIATPLDDGPLAAALADAKQAFGELKCDVATKRAEQAISWLATRQAAGLPVPDLPRAWAYVLLCADRAGDTDEALLAAQRLRVVGGSPDVPASVMAKYPEIDTTADRDLIDIDVTTATPGAALWVDFAPAGTTPAHLQLASGPHLIAAALGTQRGYAIGTVTRKQKTVPIELTDMAGKWSALAARVASWHGKVPAPEELGAVIDQVHARVAVVRHGDTIEAWGHAGQTEPVRVLGGSDGVRVLGEADRLAALITDRVQTWSAHAPDPDRPLLVESADDRKRGARGEVVDEPTKWWVYASIVGAVLAGVAIVYVHDNESNTQRVELHYP